MSFPANANDPRIAAAASGFRVAAVWARSDGTDIRIQAGTCFEAQSQTIALAQPTDLTVGSSSLLTATASSGLPVTLVSGTPATCSLTGNHLADLAPGKCTIVAGQPGNVDFLPAADVTRTVTVVAPAVPIVRRQQVLTCAKTPPSKRKKRGTTVVLPKNCRTDAGQPVTVQVNGKP